MAARTVINGRYELQELPLAKGGMGEVWVGRDLRLDREIAVKFVRFPDGDSDDELVRRFVRESRITARLQHPGVPAVFDVGTHDERPYMVLQRVHGRSMSDLIAEHDRLPLGWSIAIAAQTCSVLMVAHQASLVHRDLKPGNLMLEPDGTVKVLDFGLAVALDMSDMSQITRSGQAIGTPAYMAPEQILSTTSSSRSDLYSLGCVLHEMLTGRQVFTGSTSYSVMNKQVDERPLSPRRFRPDVPIEVDELVTALLEKDAKDRPESADAVYERLLPFVEDLEMLPGALHSPSARSPVRMYAAVLSRVFSPSADPPAGAKSTAQSSEVGENAATGASGPRDTIAEKHVMERAELERVKAEAAAWVQRSNYQEAAELLRATVGSASQAFGSSDSDVVGMRLEWANVLFEGGEYRKAEPVYRQLADDLARRDGPDAELVLRCRLHNATCHALSGDTSRALQAMDSLLNDEWRVFGPDDPRTLELRRQIGLLQVGAGRDEDANKTLTTLLDDLLRVHGDDHPSVIKVRELLDDLPGHGS